MEKRQFKATAQAFVCTNKDESIEAIKQIGDAKRDLQKIETELNDIIAAETAKRSDEIERLNALIEKLGCGVKIWCEANRKTLCKNGSKTADLLTGDVSWRKRPARVLISNKNKVIRQLEENNMEQFLRIKTEVNKEAILASPAVVKDIDGIVVETGIEDFTIKPLEVDVTE